MKRCYRSRGASEIVEHKPFYYESAVNFIVIIICWVIVFLLSAGFMIEYFKGTRTLGFVLPIIGAGVVSVLAGTIFYIKNPLTKYVRYVTFSGFYAMYVFTLLTATTSVTFTFVFPLATLFCIYVDRWFIIVICSLVLLLNGVYIAQQFMSVSKQEVGKAAYDHFTTTMLIHGFVLLLFMSSIIAIVYVFHRLRQAMDHKVKEAHHAKETGQKWYAQATIDGLTGVFNRRHFVDKVREQLSAGGAAFSLLLLDIDNFKKVNDVQGHLAGDLALVTISDLLSEVYDGIGMVGRVGGEEFAVFVNGRGEDESAALAERLRQNIESKIINLSKDIQFSITASGGIAYASRSGMTFEELFQLADKALYLSKDYGKNKITRASNN